MKKLILILLVFACFTAKSQTEKGTIQVGIGGLPIIYLDNSLPTGYSLRSNIGYFVKDNLAVGVIPFAGRVDDMKGVGVAVYSRYYFTNKKLSIFLEGSIGIGRMTYDHAPEYNGTMSTLSIGPGIGYNVSDKLTIELLPQYVRFRNESHRDVTRIGKAFIPTIGIQFRPFK